MARRRKLEPFRINLSRELTPLEALGVTLVLSLEAYVPDWPGCTDAQLEKVSRDVIKHLRNEADKILDRSKA